MNITVIYSTGRKAQSCTYKIVQLLIKELLADEASALAPILTAMEQSTLIIFCTPTYVFHVPGQMKTLLDYWRMLYETDYY